MSNSVDPDEMAHYLIWIYAVCESLLLSPVALKELNQEYDDFIVEINAYCTAYHHENIPLKPHFYIVQLGFTGVYIFFFLFLLKNIDCGYSLEPPHRGGSNEYPRSIFEQ